MEFLKKIVILSLFVFLAGSCNKISKEFSLEGSCEDDAKAFREIECLQIFERLPTLESYRLKSEGKHLITGEDCICDDGTRALGNYADILEKGDTIIKRKGELTFSIHKKDTVIVVKWECEGKVYE
ncbi:hypothetical protein P3875_01170 [Myroides sp. JBRI-B21084]|uniref:hypothetical protein n=1 Tax=Myroides sp. JBRI-B21084 TaxID=3119977 RepID=UPI0026E2BDE5|nr:hypothetical protein [Paenimyroides cloacae]WKW46712.1 hypothetical protein P3875_01170 [Paenimyroides cloacae]